MTTKTKKPVIKEKKSQVTTTPGGHGKVVKKAASKKPIVKSVTASATKKAPVAVEREKEIVYSEYNVVLFVEGTKEGELTVEQAMALMGWQEESENFEFGDLYLFRMTRTEGSQRVKKKVRCLNNLENRPFKPNLARKYMSEILRRKWRMNGETIIIDEYGMVQSGQHRLIGLIWAEWERRSNPTKWKEFWAQPITIPALVFTGIDSSPETVDTIDQGAKRSAGDVRYRRRTFDTVGDREQAKMSRVLSYAVRLLWLRAGGMTVSYAKDFPISESLEFEDNHPKIREAVEIIWSLEGGRKIKNISSYISPGYAAALLYLMGACQTDHVAYDSVREESAISFKAWELAEKFWEIFVLPESPLSILKYKLNGMLAGGAQQRDEICGTVIKAWNAWTDDPERILTEEDITVKKSTDEDGYVNLDETPRIGGIDVERNSNTEGDDE